MIIKDVMIMKSRKEKILISELQKYRNTNYSIIKIQNKKLKKYNLQEFINTNDSITDI